MTTEPSYLNAAYDVDSEYAFELTIRHLEAEGAYYQGLTQEQIADLFQDTFENRLAVLKHYRLPSSISLAFFLERTRSD